MSTQATRNQTPQTPLKNGPAAAALLAGGIAAIVYGILVVLSEWVPTVTAALTWYSPVGPLSGKTTLAIIIWLVLWAILGNLWKARDVGFQRVATTALVLLVIGSLLTLPSGFFVELFLRMSGGE